MYVFIKRKRNYSTATRAIKRPLGELIPRRPQSKDTLSNYPSAVNIFDWPLGAGSRRDFAPGEKTGAANTIRLSIISFILDFITPVSCLQAYRLRSEQFCQRDNRIYLS
ncbi:hypothetical protein J6590_004569 [Homalodisca vitripennis]|nr:hypothetical protein J6590_004569 [Homalodisca vitripennis]